MVKRHCNPDKQILENGNIMTILTDIERESTTHKPTQEDLIFAPPTFFVFCHHTLHTLASRTIQPTNQNLPKSAIFYHTNTIKIS